MGSLFLNTPVSSGWSAPLLKQTVAFGVPIAESLPGADGLARRPSFMVAKDGHAYRIPGYLPVDRFYTYARFSRIGTATGYRVTQMSLYRMFS